VKIVARKIKVTKPFKYGGQEFAVGDTPEVADVVADALIKKGHAEEISEETGKPSSEGVPDFSNVGEAERPEKSGAKRTPEVTVPVKTGGRGWIDITLWLGDPNAAEDYQKRSSVVLQKKRRGDKGVEDVGNPTYLSPSQAIALVGYLSELGLRGKLHDIKLQQGS
jgi:hypothetical protein